MVIIEPLLETLAAMLEQFARLTKQVLDTVREDWTRRRLMTVPGVGPITALAFRDTIDELAPTARYEAAHMLLVRSRKWSSLRAWRMQVARRRGMSRARVAVARKLVTILHAMWRDSAAFRSAAEPAA